MIIYLSLADLEGIFSFNSFKEGVLGFFSNILNKVSRWFNWGRYREILLFSDKLLKKYLTILSSSEWKVTTAKTPSFFKIFDADIKPFSSSLISLFTKILSAWKILVALCILKFFFLLVFSISLTNPCVSISFFFREIIIWLAIFFSSFSLPKNLKIFSNS